MNLPHLTEQWQTFHDACVAEAKTLIDVPGNERAILALAQTAAVCVDVLRKLERDRVERPSMRAWNEALMQRTDIP